MSEYTVLDRSSLAGRHAQVGIRRYSGCLDESAERPAAVCVWLPGRSGNFDSVLLADPRNPKRLLAQAGLTVHAMDYRTHFVDPACREDVEACAAWNIGTLLADVDAVVRDARARHLRQPIILIGHSTGAKLAFLYAALHPRAGISGLVALDGWIRNPPHLISEKDRVSVRADLREYREGRKTVLSAHGLRKYSSSHADGNREGERRSRLFREHFRHMLTSDRPETAGRMVGAAANDESTSVIIRCVLEGDSLWPALAEVEARAMASGVHEHNLPDYARDLPRVKTPLLTITAGDRGGDFVERSVYTGRLLKDAPRQELILEGFGHMDLVVGCHLGARVCRPILDWIAALESRGSAS